jgi:hypothetical protein
VRLLALVGLAAISFLAACGGYGDDEDEDADADSSQLSEEDRAIELALDAYNEAVASGIDLEVGPCIAEELPDLPRGVVDIAHDPREEVDNDAANQCQNFISGEADHFVELDPAGNLIQAR